MKPDKMIHYSTEEKIANIKANVCGCTEEEAQQIAIATEDFTFSMLKELSKSIKTLSEGTTR